jgi:hypothetical protein
VGHDIVVAADGATIAIVVIALFFLAFPIVDVKIGFTDSQKASIPAWLDYRKAFWPSAVIILPAVILRLALGGEVSRARVQNDATVFAVILLGCGALIVISVIIEFWASAWTHERTELPDWVRWWIAAHSVAFAALVLTLPG